MGWGILAAVLLAILGIFVISRALTPSAQAPDASQPRSDASISAVSPVAGASAAESSEAPAPAGSAAPSETAVAPQPVSSAPPSSAPGVAVIEPDTMSQAERKNLLLRLIGQGVFTGVEALGTPPKVGVTALFRGLDTSLQQQFIAAAHAYVQAGAAQPVTLEVVDAQSGTTIGSYSAAEGLKLQ